MHSPITDTKAASAYRDWRGTTAIAALLAAGAALAPFQAEAIEFRQGQVFGTFDTTVSAGAILRTEDRDPDLIGISNGGNLESVNGDDGNLNYDTGLVSAAVSVNHELSLDWENYGAFFRVNYFYDYLNANQDNTEFRDLPDESQILVGRDFNLLDAFVTGQFNLGEMPLDIRAGNQVLNWGESTFIQNGINVINPIEVSRLRVPGAELRDALLPVAILDANLGITENLSVEAFYQFLWEQTEPEANGSFFSTSDIASPGSSQVFLGFGSPLVPDAPLSVVTPVTPLGSRAQRDEDRDPSNGGQFGLAARYFSPTLNDTEFGAYFINYHSRLPILSARTGSLTDLAGVTADNYADGTTYFREYPEDIQLLGASFNTALDRLGARGLSLQGEYSYKIDQPLQVDDVELLQVAVAPGAIAGACSADPTSASCQGTIAAFNTNQIIQDLGGINLGNLNSFFDREISGVREFDVSQVQATATQLFGPNFGANQVVLVGEVGATIVHDFPSGADQRLEGPGTVVGGNPVLAGPEGVETDGFGDGFSWGYVLAARADYLGAIGPVNLSPSVAFSHNVNGTTPSPLGNFVEDRKAISFGLSARFQNQIEGVVQYTNFFDGDFNLLRDRDFVSIAVRYSF